MSSKMPAIRTRLDRWVVWSRENLFNTNLNSILTVVMGIVIVLSLFLVIRFVIFDANWASAITINLRALLLGTYPEGQEIRLWLPLAIGMAVLGLVFGIWASRRTYAILIGSLAILLLFTGFEGIRPHETAEVNVTAPAGTTFFDNDSNTNVVFRVGDFNEEVQLNVPDVAAFGNAELETFAANIAEDADDADVTGDISSELRDELQALASSIVQGADAAEEFDTNLTNVTVAKGMAVEGGEDIPDSAAFTIEITRGSGLSWINDISLGLALPFMTPVRVQDPDTGVFSTMLDDEGEPVLGVSPAWWGLLLVLVGSYAISWVPLISVKRRSLRSLRENPIVLQSVLLLVVLTILITILLQQGIFPSQWSGIFIDIIVFSVGGGIMMFPIGLLLALARTSRFPVLSYSATAYIEIIRAGPLVVWLIFAFFLWNTFVPGETPEPIRYMLVFGFFGAAYIAEVVRGGLQSIPKGQFEAAFSLNLTTITTYTRIILPQAVRAVIPAIIGRFISIWKDTSLLAALGVTNLLQAGRSVLNSDFANVEFRFEVFLAVAVVYWMVSYAFSRFGRNTEKQLGL